MSQPFGGLRLHDHVLDAGGTPRMREAFVSHLDRAAVPMPMVTAEALDDAYTRLAAEHPAQAVAVRLRYIEDRTVRQSAAALGVSVRTAHVRAKAGAAQIALWTGLPSAEAVEWRLRNNTISH